MFSDVFTTGAHTQATLTPFNASILEISVQALIISQLSTCKEA
jgi:hypothetical protein